MLVGPPTVQLPVIHQRHRVALATLQLFDRHLLLAQQVFKMFVFDRQLVVFVVAVTEGSVLPIAPVVDFFLVVEDDAEVAPC